MNEFPVGLIENDIGGAIDNSPRVGVKDCLRKISAAPELIADARARAESEVERAIGECFTMLPGNCLYVAHRVAADRMRVRMIELMASVHRPPFERDPSPEYDDAGPVRSRLFGEIETRYVHPIDGTAAVVAGDDVHQVIDE